MRRTSRILGLIAFMVLAIFVACTQSPPTAPAPVPTEVPLVPQQFPVKQNASSEVVEVAKSNTQETAPANETEAKIEEVATDSNAELTANEVVIGMINFAFDSDVIIVPAGTTVTWMNEDQAPHSATASDDSFDTGLFENGEQAQITFDTPGTYTYYCILHGNPEGKGMAATIVVEEAPDSQAVNLSETIEDKAISEEATVNTIVEDVSEPNNENSAYDYSTSEYEATKDSDGYYEETAKEGYDYNAPTLVTPYDEANTYGKELEMPYGNSGTPSLAISDFSDYSSDVQREESVDTTSDAGDAQITGKQIISDTNTELSKTEGKVEQASEFVVNMQDFRFSQGTLNVPLGSTVVWKNEDRAPHSATASDGSFDTDLFGQGEQVQITFDIPGTFNYYCLLHGTPDGEGMVATIIVSDEPEAAPIAANIEENEVDLEESASNEEIIEDSETEAIQAGIEDSGYEYGSESDSTPVEASADEKSYSEYNSDAKEAKSGYRRRGY